MFPEYIMKEEFLKLEEIDVQFILEEHTQILVVFLVNQWIQEW